MLHRLTAWLIVSSWWKPLRWETQNSLVVSSCGFFKIAKLGFQASLTSVSLLEKRVDQQLPDHGERLPAEAAQPLFSLLTTGVPAGGREVWTLSELLFSQNLLGRARGSGGGEGAVGSRGGAQCHYSALYKRD